MFPCYLHSNTVDLVLNWILYLILNQGSTSRSLYAQVCFPPVRRCTCLTMTDCLRSYASPPIQVLTRSQYGPLTFFTVPLPFMIAFDLPRKRVVFFQVFFVLAVWWCAVAEVGGIKYCRFYLAQKLHEGANRCNGKVHACLAVLEFVLMTL